MIEVTYTHILSDTPVSKCYGIDDQGNPAKTSGDKVLFSGTANREVLSGSPYECLLQLAPHLEGYGPCDMLVPGSPPPGQDSYPLVTTKLLPFHDGAIARSKDYLTHRGGPCLLVLDYDFPDSSVDQFPAAGTWAATTRAIPQLEGVARLARASMTSSVRNRRTGGYATSSPRIHVYAVLDDSTQLQRVAGLIRARLILAGHCYPFVSKAGIFQCRAIIDHQAMASAERVFYEGAPNLEHEDLECDGKKRKPIVLPGGMLLASSLPDLRPEEEQAVVAIIEEMRQRPEVQHEIAGNKAQAVERQRGLSKGHYAPTEEEYDRVLATNRIEGDYQILFDDGTVASADEVALSSWKYQGKTCPDPLDPDDGRGKAKVYSGGKSWPIINSFAHGGAVYEVVASDAAIALWVAGVYEHIPVAGSVLRPLAFQYRNPTSIPPRQWLHAGHYIRGFFSVTVAPGGTGKTSFTMVEAVSMATGRALLHHRPNRRSRVWLFNGEDDLGEVERRLSAILLEFNIDPAEIDGWLFVGSGRSQPMTLASEGRDGCVIHAPVFDAIEAGVLDLNIDVLIIDPLISSHRVKENNNDSMGALAKEIAALADRANISIEVVHHVRKTGGAEVTTEDSRGGSALMDAARSGRALTKMTAEEGKRLRVENHRRYFRVGGDPKGNMVPPPADTDTKWMEIASVSLGNRTPEYPQGDSVGVARPFTPDQVDEQISNAALMEERRVIAFAVLEALAGEPEAQLSQLAPSVTPALNEHQITKSTDRLVTRDIITAALAGKSGVTVERDGHLVRVRAEKRGIGPKAPWVVVATAAEMPADESDAKKGVFS